MYITVYCNPLISSPKTGGLSRAESLACSSLSSISKAYDVAPPRPRYATDRCERPHSPLQVASLWRAVSYFPVYGRTTGKCHWKEGEVGGQSSEVILKLIFWFLKDLLNGPFTDLEWGFINTRCWFKTKAHSFCHVVHFFSTLKSWSSLGGSWPWPFVVWLARVGCGGVPGLLRDPGISYSEDGSSAWKAVNARDVF